jgi:hypothetical protein
VQVENLDIGFPLACYTGWENKCERREMRGVQGGLWSVLYRPVHFVAIAGDARGKTGRSALYSPDME